MAFDVTLHNKGSGTVRRPPGGRGELALADVDDRFSLLNGRR